MATIKWESPATIESILTTELNTLGNGSNKTSASLSNDAAGELYLFADFELYVATQGSARSAGAYVSLYVLEEIDGTNYTYGDDSTDPPASAWAGNFPLDAVVTARYVHLREVPLPPQNFKVLVMNETGQAFASSGNTLKMVRYNYQSS